MNEIVPAAVVVGIAVILIRWFFLLRRRARGSLSITVLRALRFDKSVGVYGISIHNKGDKAVLLSDVRFRSVDETGAFHDDVRQDARRRIALPCRLGPNMSVEVFAEPGETFPRKWIHGYVVKANGRMLPGSTH